MKVIANLVVHNRQSRDLLLDEQNRRYWMQWRTWLLILSWGITSLVWRSWLGLLLLSSSFSVQSWFRLGSVWYHELGFPSLTLVAFILEINKLKDITVWSHVLPDMGNAYNWSVCSTYILRTYKWGLAKNVFPLIWVLFTSSYVALSCPPTMYEICTLYSPVLWVILCMEIMHGCTGFRLVCLSIGTVHLTA